jgi:ribonucleoside-diphosphate reductase beta chain
LTTRLAGYEHLLRAAERLQWDERDLDLGGDVVPPALRGELTHLLAGFCVAEAAVAEHLAPFATASPDPLLAECFRVQALDEARHARFFDRAWREVLHLGDGGVAAARAGVALCSLFKDELPRRAATLAAGGPLPAAVGLYHLVLEGVVFAIGQAALLDLLREAATLPGLTAGVQRVQSDERWHIGLGVTCLAGAGAADLDLGDTFALALRAWDPAVRRRVDLDAVTSGHLRRLRLADQRPLDHPADVGDVVVEGLRRPLAGVDGREHHDLDPARPDGLLAAGHDRSRVA